MNRRLCDLLPGLPLELVRGAPETFIHDLTEDSRTVTPGCLFVARPGLKSDGRAFIADALSKGAVAVLTDDPGVPVASAALLVSPQLPLATALLAERFFASPSRALHLIGVTGTNGKTTTVHLVHQLLNRAGSKCGLIGTVQVDDGFALRPGTLTTPMPIDLSRVLARMVEAGCRNAVMEASSHALHQGRTAALSFRTGLFTNLTGDHLDYHKTMESYAAAKAILFERLPSAADGGCAIANFEDPWAPSIVRDCRARLIGFGFGEPPAAFAARTSEVLTARILRMSVRGTRAHFTGLGIDADLDLPLVGRHNVANAMGAAILALQCGLPADQVLESLSSCAPPAGRMEPVFVPGAPDPEFTVLVDYAHTDDALDNVLRAARGIVVPPGRLIVLFGCGGDRDRTKRPRMAAAACSRADLVWITSDNPRTESPDAIVAEILAGVPSGYGGRVKVEVDRRTAIRSLVAHEAQPRDVIVLAGKGHEDYQIIGTTKRPFDDRAIAREAMAQRLGVALAAGAAVP